MYSTGGDKTPATSGTVPVAEDSTIIGASKDEEDL
jgi:hypothetical protein